MAKESPVKPTTNAFTPNEAKIMSLAWQCFEGEPKVNYEKLAELCGMGNKTSASNAWARIKKKLAAQAGENGVEVSEQSTPNATPKATMKRKKDVDVDEKEVSPTKKAIGRTGKSEVKVDGVENGAPVKHEELEEEGDVAHF